MPPENIESFGLLALFEPEAREPEEHVRRTAADSKDLAETGSGALRVDDAEQVALGILEDHEVFARLPRPIAGRPEAQQPFDFSFLVVRVQVEMQSAPLGDRKS